YDGSESAERALNYAIEFAREYGRLNIHLLNVQDEPVVYGDYLTASLLESLREAALRAANAVLQPARARLEAAQLPHHAHVALGAAADQIAEAADAHGCDTGIMATRGKTGLSNLLLGSSGTRVVHLVEVPVLLVK